MQDRHLFLDRPVLGAYPHDEYNNFLAETSNRQHIVPAKRANPVLNNFMNPGRQKNIPRLVTWLRLLAVLLLFPRGAFSQPPAPAKTVEPPSIADFEDIAEAAGLTAINVFGGADSKKYIIETTGTGVAVFDYDNDGWPDIFLVNGTTLEGFPLGQAPTNHLYHNNHDGTFTDVTTRAGLVATGWGQGACVGDYDNDGWEDLYVTYYGKNRFGKGLGYGLRIRRLQPGRSCGFDGGQLRGF